MGKGFIHYPIFTKLYDALGLGLVKFQLASHYCHYSNEQKFILISGPVINKNSLLVYKLFIGHCDLKLVYRKTECLPSEYIGFSKSKQHQIQTVYLVCIPLGVHLIAILEIGHSDIGFRFYRPNITFPMYSKIENLKYYSKA